MTRRFAVLAGALLAAVSFSSCSTFDRNDVAAEVHGVQLTNEVVAGFVDRTGQPLTAAGIREVVGGWIQVQVLSDEPVENLTTIDEIQAAIDAAVDGLVTDEELQQGRRELYQSPESPILCLAVIAPGADSSTEEVLAALDGGMPFADAARQYSIDRTAPNGGVVLVEGAECVSPASINPDVVGQLSAAGASPGVPVPVVVGDSELILQLRPFDEIPADDQIKLGREFIQQVAERKLEETSVFVNSRIGVWNAVTAQVDPLVAP